MDSQITNRLIYYAAQFRKPFPSVLEPLFTFGSLINNIAVEGLENAASKNGVTIEQLYKMYEEGRAIGSSEFKDYCELVFLQTLEYINKKSNTLTADTQSGYLEAALTFRKAHKIVSFLTKKNISFVDLTDEGFELFITGTPLDNMFASDTRLGFLPQSLFTMMSLSGVGKTTVFLSLAHHMKLTGAADEVWFVTTEVGEGHIHHKLKSVPNISWNEKDRLLVSYSAKEVAEMAAQNPNPNRIIFYDSPDSDAEVYAGGRDAMAYGLYYMYAQEAVTHSKMGFITSQANRQGEDAVLNGKRLTKVHIEGSVQKYNISQGFFTMLNGSVLDPNQEAMHDGQATLYFDILKYRHDQPAINRWKVPFNYRTFEYGIPIGMEYGEGLQ